MSTSTTGTPGQGSTTTTPMAPGSQQTAETSMIAGMIYPHVANGPSDSNSAAQAVQIALLIQDESAKQEKAKAKDDAAKADAAQKAAADAAGGLVALANDPIVQQGMGPGASPADMKAALDRIKAAAQAAASQASGSGSGAGSVDVTAQAPSGKASTPAHR